MLTAAELASMRTTTASSLPDSAVVQTQAWNSDGGGGGTTVWTASGTVDCRIAPVGGAGDSEGRYGDRISADSEVIFTMAHDEAVTANSRLIHSAGTFNVEAIRYRSWETTKRIEAKRES